MSLAGPAASRRTLAEVSEVVVRYYPRPTAARYLRILALAPPLE